MFPEAKFAQASKFRRSIQNSRIRSRISQNSPGCMFRIRQYTDFFIPQHSPCHPMIHVHLAIMSEPSTERNSTMPLPAFFCRSLNCLLNSRIFWCSGLLLSSFFSGYWLERLEASLVFVGDSKTRHLIVDTYDPCTQRFEHHACHNQALRETAPCRYQPFLSLVGCLLNSRKLWCSGLLLSAFSVELALNAVKLPLVLCWSKQHNVTDIWAPCSMSQHNTVGEQHTTLRTVFLVRKIVPQRLGVCGKPWIKGYQQGAIPLIIGGWPTKRPMMRAANVPATFHLRTWPGG